MQQPSLPFGDPLLSLARDNIATFRPGFVGWLATNLHVWIAFEREASRVWAKGRRHYSARTIGEVLRHESAISDDGQEFKLNNVTFPDLARLYMLRYPERAGFFETRLQTGSERAA